MKSYIIKDEKGKSWGEIHTDIPVEEVRENLLKGYTIREIKQGGKKK